MHENQHTLFDLLVLSLGNAALISLGLVADKDHTPAQKDLESAKYHIELLEMLENKTRGNLIDSEKQILTDILYDLRLKYVEARR